MRAARSTARSGEGLAALQRWLFARVTSPAGPEAAVGGRAGAGRVLPGGLAAVERIEIYRRGYSARLIECLADDYPAVREALGRGPFERLCREFIAAHPPASASLNAYGAPFPEFCRHEGLALVADLARLEWAVVEATHAEAWPLLDAAALGALAPDDWASARLVPSRALRVLRSDHAVHGYYRGLLGGERPRPPARQPSVMAVCRRGDDVWRLPIALPHASVLERLIEGQPLAGALDALASVEGEAEAGLASLQRAFADWVGCGFFSGARLG